MIADTQFAMWITRSERLGIALMRVAIAVVFVCVALHVNLDKMPELRRETFTA